jgi:hypothetical protein
MVRDGRLAILAVATDVMVSEATLGRQGSLRRVATARLVAGRKHVWWAAILEADARRRVAPGAEADQSVPIRRTRIRISRMDYPFGLGEPAKLQEG